MTTIATSDAETPAHPDTVARSGDLGRTYAHTSVAANSMPGLGDVVYLSAFVALHTPLPRTEETAAYRQRLQSLRTTCLTGFGKPPSPLQDLIVAVNICITLSSINPWADTSMFPTRLMLIVTPSLPHPYESHQIQAQGHQLSTRQMTPNESGLVDDLHLAAMAYSFLSRTMPTMCEPATRQEISVYATTNTSNKSSTQRHGLG